MQPSAPYRLGLISDTHGSVPCTERALAIFDRHGPIDLIVHLGDVCYHGPRNPLPEGYLPADVAPMFRAIPKDRIVFVRGNCDNAADEKACGHELATVTRHIDTPLGLLLLEHGDLRTDEARVAEAKAMGASFSITGHTHIKQAERVDGIICLNPGSPTLPKDQSPSCAIVTADAVTFYHTETGEVLRTVRLDALSEA